MKNRKEKYKSLAASGYTKAEVARMFGISQQAVHIFCKKNGIEFKSNKIPDAVKKRVFSLYEEGLMHKEIAEQVDMGRDNVAALLARNGRYKYGKRTTTYRNRPEQMDKKRFTPQQIISRYGYCPKTGKVRDKDKGGFVVGSVDARGYLITRFNGFSVRVHRIAWVCFYMSWPNDVIDHINGIKTDNRISNLRDVTCGENVSAYHERKKANLKMN